MTAPTNLLTAGRQALIARLQVITTTNGYLTNTGTNVRMGWFNEVLKSDGVGFPLIVVQKGRDLAPKPGPTALKAFNGFYVIGAVDAGLDDYEDALEEVAFDLLRVLTPSEGVPPDWLPRGLTNVTVGAAETFPPGNGERAASVLIPVHLHTIIDSIGY
ncbi:hypothetical protein FQZ97_463160 [compost metagenome]